MKSPQRYWILAVALTLAGAAIAVAVSFTVTPKYVSSARFQVVLHDPKVASEDRINALWQDLVSRHSLSELIQRPSLDLYSPERERLPLEDVIEQMKREDISLDLQGTSFDVHFRYPDPAKAQAVIQAITFRIVEFEIDGERPFRLLTPASRPASSSEPDRLLFLEWGLGAGLLGGILAAALWWRPLWSAKLLGYGMAGAAIIGALSFLITDRYVSRAMMRAGVSREWSFTTVEKASAEVSAWIEQSRSEVLEDASLSEIMQRPSLSLYPDERKRLDLLDVIRRMRADLTIERVGPKPQKASPRHAFLVSFVYSDPEKAQKVVSAVVTKITDRMLHSTPPEMIAAVPTMKGCESTFLSDCDNPSPVQPRPATPLPLSRKLIDVDLLDPASLPESAESPNRWLLALYGFGAGLWLGIANLRYPPKKRG